MARFDLIDEYISLLSFDTRRTGRDDWPEHFEDSHPGVLQPTGRSAKPTGFGGLLLFTLAGTVLGLIRKDIL